MRELSISELEWNSYSLIKVGEYYVNLDSSWVIVAVVIKMFNAINIIWFTRSGKSKADEGEQNSELIQIITSKFNRLKQDLISEIESLIQLEVEKVVRKQKEEFD